MHWVPAAGGRSVAFFQQALTIKSTADDTRGAVGAVEVRTPGGAAPPLHIHEREDEVFYILEGEYVVYVGGDAIDAGPESWIYAPRGVPHGYQIRSSAGRHLSLTIPAGFEAFFEEVAEFATPSTSPPSVMGRLAAVAAKYGVKLLGPPPSR